LHADNTTSGFIFQLQSKYLYMPKASSTPQIEAATQKYRVLMIDLENCPNQIYQLMNNLEQYSQIVICYAQSGAKIPLDWILPLTAVVNEERLRIVKCPPLAKMLRISALPSGRDC
jgi:hypothetical protein